ncbi:BA75_01373T0 [Komagataella pastoris]|uniref:BA75_01373T0 n=1 Tax=Komagataella pastoris TaxID=4922 RepID=A0A1B2J8Q6_PICPA|nr:BA75_01373T0 [Komagataella pastoris]
MNSVSPPNDLGKTTKSGLELEPNPFEQSFASKPSSDTKDKKVALNPKQQPNLSTEGASPTVLTPGGSKKNILPPLTGLSPGGSGLSITPGAMWNVNLNSSTFPGLTNHHSSQSLMQQFVLNARRSGLTPNESYLRTGLTPIPQVPVSQVPVHQVPVMQGQVFQGPLPQAPHPPQGVGSQVPSSVNNPYPVPPALISNLSSLLAFPSTTEPPQSLKKEETQLPTPITSLNSTDCDSAKDLKVKKESSKSKKRTASVAITDEKSAEADSKRTPADEEGKRKSFLERNRVAASKCRQRKKQKVQRMEEELNFYSQNYNALNFQVNMLREQVLTLRTILYSHHNCPTLIDQLGGVENLNAILNSTQYVDQGRKTVGPEEQMELGSTMMGKPANQIQLNGLNTLSNQNSQTENPPLMASNNASLRERKS